LEHRYRTHNRLARVSNSRGTRENVPYAIVESKRVQRSFDSRSAAALLRASLRMTSEKSAEVLRLALGRCASSRFAQDESGEV
jgi:hypothetical protein